MKNKKYIYIYIYKNEIISQKCLCLSVYMYACIYIYIYIYRWTIPHFIHLFIHKKVFSLKKDCCSNTRWPPFWHFFLGNLWNGHSPSLLFSSFPLLLIFLGNERARKREESVPRRINTRDCLSSDAWPQTRQRINQLPLHFSNQTTLLSGISSSTWKGWRIKGCCDVAARALWLGANREWLLPSTPGGETQRGRDTHTNSGAHTYVHILRC